MAVQIRILDENGLVVGDGIVRGNVQFICGQVVDAFVDLLEKIHQ